MENETIPSPQQCLPHPVYKVALLLPLPIIGMFINIMVGYAATYYRKTLLRQNSVYQCVISTLLSNLVFLVLNVWDYAATWRAINDNRLMNVNTTERAVWVLCQAAAASMLFVISWNLCAFIYVMLDTTYFNSAAKNNKDASTASVLKRKRYKTMFLIIFSWTLPTIMTLFAVFYWNCSEICLCVHGAQGELCPFHGKCSRLWPPLRNGFMGLQVGLWFIEVVALVVFVVRGFRHFIIFSGSGKGSTNHVQVNVDGEHHKPAHADGNGSHGGSDGVGRRRIPSWSSWNPRLRLAAILSALFVLLTASIMISFFIDLSGFYFEFEIARFVSQTLVHLYAIVCPIMMVHYMPNLRRALVRFCTAMLFCC